MTLRIAIHQMASSTDSAENVASIERGIAESAKNAAAMYFAPEMSVLLDRDRHRAAAHIFPEADHPDVQRLSVAAADAGIWVHMGSLAVRLADGRFANRSLVFGPDGAVRARYDKMHLFDVDLASGETWRESAVYKAGDSAQLVETPIGPLGLAICYDLRFPDLFSHMAKRGARAFAVPAAFTVPTGKAHWHILLRARAIESAAFVIAAAQSGHHADGRQTYGHSLVIDPWGEVLLDMGEGEGVGFADLDLTRVDDVRRQVPVHINRRDIV